MAKDFCDVCHLALHDHNLEGEPFDHDQHAYCEWCGEPWPGNYGMNCGACSGPLTTTRQYTLEGEPHTIFRDRT